MEPAPVREIYPPATVSAIPFFRSPLPLAVARAVEGGPLGPALDVRHAAGVRAGVPGARVAARRLILGGLHLDPGRIALGHRVDRDLPDVAVGHERLQRV